MSCELEEGQRDSLPRNSFFVQKIGIKSKKFSLSFSLSFAGGGCMHTQATESGINWQK